MRLSKRNRERRANIFSQIYGRPPMGDEALPSEMSRATAAFVLAHGVQPSFVAPNTEGLRLDHSGILDDIWPVGVRGPTITPELAYADRKKTRSPERG